MSEKIELVIKDNIAIIRLMDPENFNPLNKNTGKKLLETMYINSWKIFSINLKSFLEYYILI